MGYKKTVTIPDYDMNFYVETTAYTQGKRIKMLAKHHKPSQEEGKHLLHAKVMEIISRHSYAMGEELDALLKPLHQEMTRHRVEENMLVLEGHETTLDGTHKSYKYQKVEELARELVEKLEEREQRKLGEQDENKQEPEGDEPE